MESDGRGEEERRRGKEGMEGRKARGRVRSIVGKTMGMVVGSRIGGGCERGWRQGDGAGAWMRM